jgi:hypothetical protein
VTARERTAGLVAAVVGTVLIVVASLALSARTLLVTSLLPWLAARWRDENFSPVARRAVILGLYATLYMGISTVWESRGYSAVPALFTLTDILASGLLAGGIALLAWRDYQRVMDTVPLAHA